jgi:hypothetical protein
MEEVNEWNGKRWMMMVKPGKVELNLGLPCTNVSSDDGCIHSLGFMPGSNQTSSQIPWSSAPFEFRAKHTREPRTSASVFRATAKGSLGLL